MSLSGHVHHVALLLAYMILSFLLMAERLNRTLLERIWAFAHESGLPQSLWGKSLRHVSWLKNCTATCALDGKTSFEVLYGQPPDLQSLRIWGCQVWVHSPGRSKLDPRAKEVRWLGVDVDARTHCIFWPAFGKVSVERDVYFGPSAQLEGEESILDATGEGINLPDKPSAPQPSKLLPQEQAAAPPPALDSAKTSQPVLPR